jgi:hypothetical protein
MAFFCEKLQEITAGERNMHKAQGKCHIRKVPAISFLQDQRF